MSSVTDLTGIGYRDKGVAFPTHLDSDSFFSSFRPLSLRSVVRWLGPLVGARKSDKYPLRSAALIALEKASLSEALDCLIELAYLITVDGVDSPLVDKLCERSSVSPFFAIQLLFILRTL